MNDQSYTRIPYMLLCNTYGLPSPLQTSTEVIMLRKVYRVSSHVLTWLDFGNRSKLPVDFDKEFSFHTIECV